MAITLHITDYSGESRGGVGGVPPPLHLFLEHSEARRAEKFGDAPHFSQGLDPKLDYVL